MITASWTVVKGFVINRFAANGIWIQNGGTFPAAWFSAFLVAVMILQAIGVMAGKMGDDK